MVLTVHAISAGDRVGQGMGKRKSSKPPPKKVRPKLDKAFNCPFCNSAKSAAVSMDKEVWQVGLCS